jgi:diadenosine tetraphosphate (Ap4A) HIT family hydrolase
LSGNEWIRYAVELQRTETAIMRVVDADHINVELLGNSVPHLHWHIIPRYKNEDRWGIPIWTTDLSELPKRLLDEDDYAILAEKLNNALN